MRSSFGSSFLVLRAGLIFLFKMVVFQLRFSLSLLERETPIKTLKPSFFVSGVVRTFVGTAQGRHRHLRTIPFMLGGFKHRMMNITQFVRLWNSQKHMQFEQKYRSMTNKPLLNRSCRPASTKEDQRIRLERMSESPVYFESLLG